MPHPAICVPKLPASTSESSPPSAFALAYDQSEELFDTLLYLSSCTNHISRHADTGPPARLQDAIDCVCRGLARRMSSKGVNHHPAELLEALERRSRGKTAPAVRNREDRIMHPALLVERVRTGGSATQNCRHSDGEWCRSHGPSSDTVRGDLLSMSRKAWSRLRITASRTSCSCSCAGSALMPRPPLPWKKSGRVTDRFHLCAKSSDRGCWGDRDVVAGVRSPLLCGHD